MTRARLRRSFRHGFLPQLVAFEACARHGSVTRAAEELSLAQPTVSCLLRKLSDTVGGPVLEARARRMEPTRLGRELLVLCDEVFDAFDRLDGRLAGADEGMIGSSPRAGAPDGPRPA
jgi:DNA-binding transcriptional LysR family regulator